MIATSTHETTSMLFNPALFIWLRTSMLLPARSMSRGGFAFLGYCLDKHPSGPVRRLFDTQQRCKRGRDVRRSTLGIVPAGLHSRTEKDNRYMRIVVVRRAVGGWQSAFNKERERLCYHPNISRALSVKPVHDPARGLGVGHPAFDDLSAGEEVHHAACAKR